MFNKGLDVPDVDMIMFLRPTESPTIFLQQLGRGLRKKDEKKYLKGSPLSKPQHRNFLGYL